VETLIIAAVIWIPYFVVSKRVIPFPKIKDINMVKLQVFGNISKTVSNIKNLTWGKNDQHIKMRLVQ
jgi:hypothetical protein